MASSKKVLSLVALGAVFVAAGGGFAYYRHAETTDRLRREQLFADLSQCLVGKVVTSDADVLNEYASLENWTMQRPPEMRGKAKGGAWPDRCAAQATALSDAARDSAFMEKDDKVALLDAVGILSKDLSAQAQKRSACAGDVTDLWRKASEHHWGFASTSKVEGPARPTSMEGAPEAPFASLLPLEGGPEWAFFTAPKDKGPLGFCTLAKSGLACKNLDGDGHATVAGTWESASFIPILQDGELKLIHDGKIEGASVKGTLQDASADRDGGLLAVVVDGSNDTALVVKPYGKRSHALSLKEALASAPGAVVDAVPAAKLAGHDLFLPAADALYRAHVKPSGDLEAPVAVPGARGGITQVCRSGATRVLELSAGGQRTAVLVDEQGGAKTVSVPSRIRCGTGGEVWAGDQVCTAAGCHDPLAPSVRSNLHESAAVGVVGDKVVVAWLVSAGRGMLARVAPDNDTSDTPDVVIAPKTDVEPHQRVAIFGGPQGALALAETKSGLIGAHVTSDGKVEPIRIETK